MERYQVILAYDGSHFKGFQRQAKDRSVQGVVETALRELGWQGRSILAAGRTDTGAHATGQVIAFDLDWNHGIHDLQVALNNHLPSDVVASEVKQVNPAFHPRYDASWRRYRYRIFCQPLRQPLLEPFAWRVWPAVEMSLLHEAASILVGTHDFGSFGTPPQTGGHTIRRVLEASWEQDEPYVVFDIKAHAFLYHMVRRLVFMQVSIAQGKLEIHALGTALDPSKLANFGVTSQLPNQKLVHGLAPAKGLILTEVGYPTEATEVSEENVDINNSVDRQLDPSG